MVPKWGTSNYQGRQIKFCVWSHEKGDTIFVVTNMIAVENAKASVRLWDFCNPLKKYSDADFGVFFYVQIDVAW